MPTIPEQYNILNPYNPNTNEAINSYKKYYCLFRDTSGDLDVDFSQPLPDLTAVAYDPYKDTTAAYFYTTVENSTANVRVSPGIVIINNVMVEIVEPSTLNLRTNGHYINGAAPTGLNSTYYIYLIANYDPIAGENILASLSFCRDINYSSVRDKSAILKVIKIITDSNGNVASSTLYDAHPLGGSYANDYVLRIVFWEKLEIDLDGGWIDE